MNIVFMGTPAFAEPSLKILLTSHHNISAVVTSPDKPQGRGLKPAPSQIKSAALENNLKILQPENLKDTAFINELKIFEPDLIVVVAFRILPPEVFTIPKYGSFNLHASLLPKYRGAAPINWALINGERESGVTTFFLKEKVDTGDIILQNSCIIDEDDDAGSLHEKLAELGARTVLSTVSLIEMTNGNVPVYSQDESLFTKAPKINREFCKINWVNSRETVYNFIRGLSPYPTAYAFHNSKQIKIFKTSKPLSDVKVNGTAHKPGMVVMQGKSLYVCCADDYIEVTELQLAGKKRMATEDFLKGYRLISGDTFSS